MIPSSVLKLGWVRSKHLFGGQLQLDQFFFLVFCSTGNLTNINRNHCSTNVNQLQLVVTSCDQLQVCCNNSQQSSTTLEQLSTVLHNPQTTLNTLNNPQTTLNSPQQQPSTTLKQLSTVLNNSPPQPSNNSQHKVFTLGHVFRAESSVES